VEQETRIGLRFGEAAWGGVFDGFAQ